MIKLPVSILAVVGVWAILNHIVAHTPGPIAFILGDNFKRVERGVDRVNEFVGVDDRDSLPQAANDTPDPSLKIECEALAEVVKATGGTLPSQCQEGEAQ